MKILESNVTIMTKDMSKSISFYESIGFTLKQRWGDFYAQVAAPGIIIGLHPANANTAVNTSENISIGFTVDNFEEAKSLLFSLSIAAKARDEEGGQFLHFADPDGSSLYFIKPKWQ
ncbi:MAG TPA: VOC family protein [Puia sp.]|nr:VOC family protein [Puia sp.]